MTAGPAALMATLLPTKRPAPMMPPMVIMATWRGRSDRLNSWDSVGVAVVAFMTSQYSGSWRSARRRMLAGMQLKPLVAAATLVVAAAAVQAASPARPRAPDIGL